MSEEGNTVDKKDYENEEHLHIIALQQLKLKLKDVISYFSCRYGLLYPLI